MQQIKQLKRITSKRLTELLFAKKSGRITPEENEELGIYADNFANIILKTPKMKRFLFLYDEKGRFDHQDQKAGGKKRGQIKVNADDRAKCHHRGDDDRGKRDQRQKDKHKLQYRLLL